MLRYDPAMRPPRATASARTVPVVAAVFPPTRVSPLELAAAVEIFGEARPDLGGPFYELRCCGGEGRRARALGGFDIVFDHDLAGLEGAHTVIAMPWDAGDTGGEPGARVLDALRRAHEGGARMVSFCTGAFVLAAAGILDGRRATTHWRRAAELAERHPEVAVDPRVLYVDDGDVLTSAGAAASIDLALHLVRLDHGADVASAIARRAVVAPHRDGGQAQYVEMPVPEAEPDSFSGTLEWALEHLDEALAVADLAERAHMSPRTFARRFGGVTGSTPHQWLLRQRVLHAQVLLESTDEPVERIAQRCGFGAASALRQQFQRVLGTSPQAYRRTFRGGGAPSAVRGVGASR
jgi:transcriptional regulator GlxA family with amidase domain